MKFDLRARLENYYEPAVLLRWAIYCTSTSHVQSPPPIRYVLGTVPSAPLQAHLTPSFASGPSPADVRKPSRQHLFYVLLFLSTHLAKFEKGLQPLTKILADYIQVLFEYLLQGKFDLGGIRTEAFTRFWLMLCMSLR